MFSPNIPLFLLYRQKKSSPKTVRIIFLLNAESLVETVNTSTGVNQLLLAGIERVALGANFHTDILLGRTGGKDVATGATDVTGRKLVIANIMQA